MKIKSIKTEKYKGKVYNISVGNNHNYYANGILVHNCHENSTPDGACGKLTKNGNQFYHEFFNTLRPGTEVALGGGALTSIPRAELTNFLALLRSKGIIPNITINQRELSNHMDYIQSLINNGLVFGVGVSFVNYKDVRFLNFCKNNKNVVIHVINGVINEEALEYLADNDLKMLVLGYKDFRRGKLYKSTVSEIIKENQKYLFNNINKYFERFKVVSFDNLALEQLEINRFLSEEEWNEFYMGEDGTSTMYIDLVQEKFAKNSTFPEEKRLSLLNSIDEMFKIVKEKM